MLWKSAKCLERVLNDEKYENDRKSVKRGKMIIVESFSNILEWEIFFVADGTVQVVQPPNQGLSL